MKRGKKVGFTLNPNNEAALLERIKAKTVSDNYGTFLQAIAQSMDLMCKGENVYLTLGMTRDRSGLLLVVNWDDDKTFLVAGSLAGLSDECSTLLDDVESP